MRTTPQAAAPRAERTLELALALFFLLAGAALLADTPALGPDVDLLTDLTGAGSWLRVGSGAADVLGAALLVAPRAAGVGAALLGGVMTAMAAAYVLVLHAAPAAPGVLLAGLAVVAYVRRADLAAAGAFLERNL